MEHMVYGYLHNLLYFFTRINVRSITNIEYLHDYDNNYTFIHTNRLIFSIFVGSKIYNNYFEIK